MAWFKRTRFTTLKASTAQDRVPEGMCTKCNKCNEVLMTRDLAANLMVCPSCNNHLRVGMEERVNQVLDQDTFVETHADMTSADPLGFIDSKPYPERISATQEKTGFREGVLTGYGQIQGINTSIAFMNFGFIGGSMGAVVGEKITRTFEYSLEYGVPAVVFCTSGGARMQEGILSLMQMAKTSALVQRLREKSIPYITVLTDPTMAGVMASFAQLGDLIIAEPEALVGFAGPRVIEATIRQVLPKGFQRSEFVQEHGFIDIIVDRRELRDRLGCVLGLLTNQVPNTELENGLSPAKV